MRRKYNIELINYLKDNAKNYVVDDLVEMVNKKFNETYIRLQLQKLLIRNKIEYKYKNKNKSHNMSKLPIGYEYVRDDGMILIKIGRNKWTYKQRYLYEKHYNIKLTPDDYIIFLDQDRTNFDINNLKVVTRRESSILANQKIFSKEPSVTKTAIDVAKLIIKSKDVERMMNNEKVI